MSRPVSAASVAASASSSASGAAPTSGSSAVRDGRARATSRPSAVSTVWAAISRYVVYLPPPIRTRPFGSVRMRCSREALTLDPGWPPGSVASGRRPVYAPTRSARVRSTASVALTFSRMSSISAEVGTGRSGGPSSSRSVVPMTQRSGHGTRKQTRPGIRSVSPWLLGIRCRGTRTWLPRLGRTAGLAPMAGNGPSARPDQTPVASMTRSARTKNDSPLSSSRTFTPAIRQSRSSAPSALTRVSGRPPSARAVRATARL